MILQTENLSLSFAGGAPILRGIDLQIPAGQVTALVGPSGCGKSTLLSLLAGLRLPTRGRVLYKGAEVRGPSRERVVIFQNHALFPWLTAEANVNFALEALGRVGQAHDYLKQVGLEKYGRYYPHQLSGGMQQRVGIARALAAEPEVFLLDEPFASLDVIHREALLQDFSLLVKRLGKTFVLVTHDIEEAIFMADRIYLLHGAPTGVQRLLDVKFAKAARILDLRHQSEYMQMEREIHEQLVAPM